MVVGQNPAKLTAPRVKTFFSISAGAQLKPTVLDLNAPDCSETIVNREPTDNWPAQEVERMWQEDSVGA